MVERTLTGVGGGVQERSLATWAAVLRQAARVLSGTPAPARVTGRRHGPVPPYPAAHLTALIDWAAAIAKPLWRDRAQWLLVAGAGLGLPEPSCAARTDQFTVRPDDGVWFAHPDRDGVTYPVHHALESTASPCWRAPRQGPVFAGFDTNGADRSRLTERLTRHRHQPPVPVTMTRLVQTLRALVLPTAPVAAFQYATGLTLDPAFAGLSPCDAGPVRPRPRGHRPLTPAAANTVDLAGAAADTAGGSS